MDLPEEVELVTKDIDVKISEFEHVIDQLLLKQQQENVTPYESAKLNLCLAYMLNSLFCCM